MKLTCFKKKMLNIHQDIDILYKVEIYFTKIIIILSGCNIISYNKLLLLLVTLNYPIRLSV